MNHQPHPDVYMVDGEVTYAQWDGLIGKTHDADVAVKLLVECDGKRIRLLPPFSDGCYWVSVVWAEAWPR